MPYQAHQHFRRVDLLLTREEYRAFEGLYDHVRAVARSRADYRAERESFREFLEALLRRGAATLAVGAE